jgi:hypothetical protein
MAKARPKAPAIDRAIAAFKKAHPSCPYGIEAHKVRSRQIIRVRGYERPGATSQYARHLKLERFGVVAEWSYSDNGSLRRVS